MTNASIFEILKLLKNIGIGLCIIEGGYYQIHCWKEEEKFQYTLTYVEVLKKYGVKICLFCDLLTHKYNTPLIENIIEKGIEK